MTFLFPDLGSLHAALLTRDLPEDVLASACAYGREGPKIWVHTDRPVPPGAFARWRIDRPTGGVEASCWAEVLPTTEEAHPEELNEVLFELPAHDLLRLAGQLLRLGCDRQRWSLQGELAWLRASAPPWYVVLTQLEKHGVYHQRQPGVWCALGVSHPLLGPISTSDQLILIDAAGPWRTVPDGPWTELYQALSLHLDGTTVSHEPEEVPQLQVHLRLVPGGHQDTPVFWLLEDRPVEQLEALLGRVPQKTLQPLRFAATAGENPVILLRAPNAKAVADLGLRARAFATLLSLPNAFRPVHTTLEPPLRQDAIRSLLAAQPYEVTWLTPSETGVDVHRIHQNAFRPLTEWVEYIVKRSERALAPWVESTTFAFEEWTDIGREWADAPESSRQDRPKRERRAPREARTRRPVRERTATALPKYTITEVKTDAAREALVAQVSELERRFSALDSPPDAPERVALWTEMGTVLRQLGRERESRLSWAQAVWHSPDPAVAQQWAAVEIAVAGLEPDAVPTQTEYVWCLAALLLAGVTEPSAELSTFFDQHDGDLDARTAWSVRERLALGDELALARGRDVVLARLRRGLVRGVDTPSFLGRVDSGTREALHAHLAAQHDHFRKTKRNRSVLEAPEVLTLAYVDLVFAWGFATLGSREHVASLRAVQLDLSDPIHEALVGAYQARIDQALQGLAREAPLPNAAIAKLQALGGLQKYKVDRLRSASGILEPRERLDPFRAYTLEGTSQASDLQKLSGDDLLAALQLQVRQPKDVDSVHQFLLALPQVPVTQASSLLEALSVEHLPPEEQLTLHADALVAAGLLGQRTLAQRHALGLQESLSAVTAEQLSEATRTLVRAFRGLRRLGLQDLATTSLEHVLTVASGKRFVDQLTRTAAAGGLALCGATERAVPLLDAAVQITGQPFDRPVDQQRMVRTLALALSCAPRDVALERLPTLASILVNISDSFNTNSHFCFSVVDFAESIVLGFSDRQLLTDPKTRTFVLDDEYLLRSRL